MTVAERYSDKRMRAPFDVLVLFEGRMQFDVSALWSDAVEAFPDALGKDGTFATGLIDTDNATSLGSVFGAVDEPVAITSFRGERCPEQHFQQAVSRAFHFREAADVLRRHSGYIAIVAPCETTDLATRYKTARVVTCLAAIAATYPGCIGLIFPSGDVIAAPDFWRKDAEQLNSDSWPLGIWISLEILSGRIGDTGSIYRRCGSVGMAAFNGHEFDYFWAPVDEVEAAEAVIGGAHLLLEQGHVFQDGDTLGPENYAERLVIRHQSEGTHAQTDRWVILHPKCPYKEDEMFGPRSVAKPPPGVDNTAKGEVGFMKRLLGRILN